MNDLDKKFDEYFNEIENYSMRSERFYEDILFMSKQPAKESFDIFKHWMLCAFEAGYEQGRKDE